MDPASVRAMACTATTPLGLVFGVMKDGYQDEHRTRSLLDTTPELPIDRCVMPVTRGRCRRTVSSVALTQYCWRHQPGGGLCYPGDAALCRWTFTGVLQTPALGSE